MNATENDDALLRAAKEYLADLETGYRPDRAAFLARHADLGPALAAYLDTLDAVHAAKPKRATTGGGGTVATSVPTEPLGDFRIVREIGRGGMGVVYEAVQMSLGRSVALKVLPFAAALDPRHLQRFKTEAQAAAQLHHPNIVPVYAVGTERGVHFYAMQLIDGRSLAAVIDELREDTAPTAATTARPGRQPTLRTSRGRDAHRAAARMAATVADALEYAHEAGVVHRDIKPGNLLIDGKGVVWVADFGLAHITSAAGPTQTGELLGTLRYMSPEQAAGQRVLVDPRADVYSLGATLYELLTLKPLFDGTTHARLLDQILNEEPVAPRQLDRAIPVELETVLLKAVAKNPGERYASAGEMAADLRRFLDDQPIRARRPSLLDRATKWARRHRAVVVSALLALVVSVAALALATSLTAWAYEREAQKASEAERQRTRAEDGLRQARRALELLAQVASEDLAGTPGSEALRRRLLEVALGYYQDFIDQHGSEPAFQEELQASRARAEAILAELTTLLYAGRYGILHWDEGVQKELRLTPPQREALGKVAESFHKHFASQGSLTSAEREHRFLALAQNQEREVSRILTPAQLLRFQQLGIQKRGHQAFADPDVVAALQPTAEQRRRIRELQENGRPGDTPERLRKILDLLSVSQRRAWDELVGAPFAFEKGGFRPGGPRPRPF